MIAAVTTIDVLGVLGGCCAVLMVAWALFLLQTGIISLQSALKDKDVPDTLNVEVQKALKVRVQSSVIALFVVALGFLGLSLYYVQANSIRPVTVTGEIQSDDNALAVIHFSTPWLEVDTTGGEVRSEIWPKVDRVNVDIATPGHDPGHIITTARPDKDHGGYLYFRPVFNATLRAAASWLFFCVAHSLRINSELHFRNVKACQTRTSLSRYARNPELAIFEKSPPARNSPPFSRQA